MDSAKAIPSGVTVMAQGTPSTYHVAPRIENPEFGTSQMTLPLMNAGSERKKRGRPRKYKPDESSSMVYSSVQVPSSAPPASGKSSAKEDRRLINSEKKYKTKVGTEKLDDCVGCLTGSSFLPHVISVNTGEDLSTKIMEFSRHGPRAVCIISGSGTVSNVTIRHPGSSGGILTYEGLFEILSLSGSFTPTDMPDSKFGRPGTMTITLSGADGRVLGGLIAGLTIAATPLKVVVASFLPINSHETKPKKHFPVIAAGPNDVAPALMQHEKSRADINISLHG